MIKQIRKVNRLLPYLDSLKRSAPWLFTKAPLGFGVSSAERKKLNLPELNHFYNDFDGFIFATRIVSNF